MVGLALEAGACDAELAMAGVALSQGASEVWHNPAAWLTSGPRGRKDAERYILGYGGPAGLAADGARRGALCMTGSDWALWRRRVADKACTR